jgi:hypothetical protein
MANADTGQGIATLGAIAQAIAHAGPGQFIATLGAIAQ